MPLITLLIVTQLNHVRALKRCLKNPVSFGKQKDDSVIKVPKIQQPGNIPIAEPIRNVPLIAVESPQTFDDGSNHVTDDFHAYDEIPSVDQPVVPDDVESELPQTVPEIRTFVSGLLDPHQLSKSIPMHRDNIRPTQHISLSEQQDNLPILNENELAQMGFFDGEQGRKISHILRQQELLNSVSANASNR